MKRAGNNRLELESRLRLSEQLLEQVCAASGAGIVVIAETGEVVFADQRFLQMWNLREDSVLGRSASALWPQVLRHVFVPDRLLSILRALTVETSKDQEWRMELRNGEELICHTAPLGVPGDCPGRMWRFARLRYPIGADNIVYWHPSLVN